MKKVRRPGVVREKSELEAEAELHAASEVSAAGMQEFRASIHAGIHAVILRVVEDVEVLPAEIESASFAEGEALEEAEVEVDATGAGKGVTADVTKGQAGRNCECVRIEEKRTANAGDVGRMRTVRVADEVGTGTGADAVGNACGIAKVGAVGNADWRAGLGDGDGQPP